MCCKTPQKGHGDVGTVPSCEPPEKTRLPGPNQQRTLGLSIIQKSAPRQRNSSSGHAGGIRMETNLDEITRSTGSLVRDYLKRPLNREERRGKGCLSLGDGPEKKSERR